MTAAIATGTVAYGITPDPSGNPFQNIAMANVFRLREPVRELAPAAPKVPLPPIKLTGIMDWLGKSRALLEVILPASPPNPAKTSFLTLSPGEVDGEIEVLRIDVKAGTAEVKLFGTITNLSLNSNVPRPPDSGRAAPAPSALAAAAAPSQPNPQLNRDETALVIEAERERLRQAGDSRANLMPATHLTPAGGPGTEVLAEGMQATGKNPSAPARMRER